jgi:hypothetical protein
LIRVHISHSIGVTKEGIHLVNEDDSDAAGPANLLGKREDGIRDLVAISQPLAEERRGGNVDEHGVGVVCECLHVIERYEHRALRGKEKSIACCAWSPAMRVRSAKEQSPLTYTRVAAKECWQGAHGLTTTRA